MVEIPVIFIIFRRPEHTRRVFAEIAQARPRRLFIVADGPRPGRADDVERCAEVRRIVDQVTWECEVTRIYADENMGCGRRIASGITQVFEQVEAAIILEDDTVPNQDFFPFCEELLARYSDDKRVMMISGSNPIGPRISRDASYYFGLPTLCWGWATWRRAWKGHYDLPMASWPALRAVGLLESLYADERHRAYWRERFDRMRAAYGQPDLSIWDFQWFFSIWAQSALSVFPEVNLVSNIGYGSEATHTITSNPAKVHFKAERINRPLRHPPYLFWDREADRLRMEQILARPPAAWRALMKVYGLVPRPVRRQIAAARLQVLARLSRGVVRA